MNWHISAFNGLYLEVWCLSKIFRIEFSHHRSDSLQVVNRVMPSKFSMCAIAFFA